MGGRLFTDKDLRGARCRAPKLETTTEEGVSGWAPRRNPGSEQMRNRGHWDMACREKDSRKTIGNNVHNPMSLRVF